MGVITPKRNQIHIQFKKTDHTVSALFTVRRSVWPECSYATSQR